jgi:hypothetical protein
MGLGAWNSNHSNVSLSQSMRLLVDTHFTGTWVQLGVHLLDGYKYVWLAAFRKRKLWFCIICPFLAYSPVIFVLVAIRYHKLQLMIEPN